MLVDVKLLEELANHAAELEFRNDSQKDKQEIWIEMGRTLEAANYDKTKISTRIRSMIDKHLKTQYADNQMTDKTVKFNSGHFGHTMKVQGWTNPDNNNSNSVAGQQRPNSSDLNEFKSSCYQERKSDIILLDKFIRLFQALTDELQIEYDAVKVGDKETHIQRDWKKYYSPDTIQLHNDLHNMITNMIDEWNQSIDKRYSLLPKMKIIAPAIVKAASTISSFCTRHYTILKSKTEISPKTYKKFMEDTKSYSDYLKLLQTDAWKYYSLPIPCADCNEYTLRTRLNSDGTWNFVCVNKLAHKEGQPEYPAEILKEQINAIIEDTTTAENLLKYYDYPMDIDG